MYWLDIGHVLLYKELLIYRLENWLSLKLLVSRCMLYWYLIYMQYFLYISYLQSQLQSNLKINMFLLQKSPLTTSTEQQQPKSKLLSTANQNQQHSNNGTGRKRNLNSPRLHLNRNRSWFGHSFSMGYGPHPISQPWYNIMPPHFLGGPSPPPFMGHRGNKWVHQSSYPAGPARFHHWSPKATLKV